MAAAMVLGDGGAKFVEQSESFDIHGEKSNSPNSEDTEEESSNKSLYKVCQNRIVKFV